MVQVPPRAPATSWLHAGRLQPPSSLPAGSPPTAQASPSARQPCRHRAGMHRGLQGQGGPAQHTPTARSPPQPSPAGPVPWLGQPLSWQGPCRQPPCSRLLCSPAERPATPPQPHGRRLQQPLPLLLDSLHAGAGRGPPAAEPGCERSDHCRRRCKCAGGPAAACGAGVSLPAPCRAADVLRQHSPHMQGPSL